MQSVREDYIKHKVLGNIYNECKESEKIYIEHKVLGKIYTERKVSGKI